MSNKHQAIEALELIVATDAVPTSGVQSEAVPALVAECGPAAQFAWDEFIYGKLRNQYTRRNYQHAVTRFLAWCGRLDVELVRIAPAHVGRYLDALDYAPATKKLHLAALRHFFDELVTRHVVILNPAASVRSERYQVIEGKTPEMTVPQARRLLASIDTSHVVGLRDRAIIGTLIYTAARVGAVARLQRGHFYDTGDQYCLRFAEKAGKSREIPVRHNLRGFIAQYLQATGIEHSEPAAPMLCTIIRRTRQFTTNAMSASDMARMAKRRLKDAGLPTRLSPHSARVGVITDLLHQGVPLSDVQHLAGHADPRTTRLYDRRHRTITRNIVERISV